MKLKEVKKRIVEILKPKDISDTFLTYRTKDISERLGYKNPSWTHYVLTLMKTERVIENVSRTKRCIWRYVKDPLDEIFVKAHKKKVREVFLGK